MQMLMRLLGGPGPLLTSFCVIGLVVQGVMTGLGEMGKRIRVKTTSPNVVLLLPNSWRIPRAYRSHLTHPLHVQC